MKKKGNVLAILTVLSLAFATLFYSPPDVVHAEENSQSVASVGGTNYGTLSEAISQANGQEIKLLKSITISEPIEVTTDTVINGGSFQIDTSGNSSQHIKQGLFHMNSENDNPVVLTLKNMKLVNKNWSYPSGVSIRASNQTLNLDNVTIDTGHYCIFVGVPGSENEDINDVTVNINKSKLTGYSAIYYRTNSISNPIMRPVLKVIASELIGRGYNGTGNGFSTIVYNGTRNARATITDSTLSNSFNATNADADEGIIQFNCWGAYEEGAEITILHSKVKTHSTTAAPNIIKYTSGDNLNVGNKVIIDDLTLLVDEHESDLIRVMRNGNELVATGKELDKVLSLELECYGDKPNSQYDDGDVLPLLEDGDVVYVPINTTLTENAVVPKNVTVVISKNAKLKVNPNIKLSGSEGSKLVVEGTVEGLDSVADEGTYIWQNNKWGALANSITLNKQNQTLKEKETIQLTATIQPENVVDKNVKWTSSNSGVANVDKNGKVTAVAPGKATITATINGKTATCEVSVYKVEEAAILKVDPKEPVKEVTVGVNEEASQVLSDTTTSIVKEIVDGKSSLVVDSQTAENVKEAINNGETIQTKIEVKKVKEEKLDETEVVKIEKALADKEDVVIAEYLDLSVLLTTSDGTPLGKVNQLKEPIKFTIALPENLKAEGRTYYIVRVHDDKAELIEATLNKDGMLEFYTDQFSTYAIAYTDKKLDSTKTPSKPNQANSDEKVKTDDSNNTLLYISIAGAAISLAVVMITDKKRKELLNK